MTIELSQNIDVSDLERIMLDAIPDQRLVEVLEPFLATDQTLNTPAQELAQQAISTCKAISNRMLGVQDQIIAALIDAGIKAGQTGDIARTNALQFHSTGVMIHRDDLLEAIDVIQELDFRTSIDLTAARISVLKQTASQISFYRFDDVTTRLVLQFSTEPPTLLPTKFRPTTADLASISLPGPLSWFYYTIKPVRVTWERLLSKRSAHHEIDFLGTPLELIEPMLSRLNLTKDDVLVDLGCGDGRILTVLAEKFGCRAIGVEHNAQLAGRAQKAARQSPANDLIEVRQGDASTADLAEATVIFMFLPTGLIAKILPSIKAQIESGVTVVMHEQARPKAFRPDLSIPIFGSEALTVLHVKNPRIT